MQRNGGSLRVDMGSLVPPSADGGRSLTCVYLHPFAIRCVYRLGDEVPTLQRTTHAIRAYVFHSDQHFDRAGGQAVGGPRRPFHGQHSLPQLQ